MIKVTFKNNGGGKLVDIVDKDTTIKEFLDDHSIDYSTGIVTLGSVPLYGADFNQTFAEMGYSDEEGKNACWISNIARKDNA